MFSRTDSARLAKMSASFVSMLLLMIKYASIFELTVDDSDDKAEQTEEFENCASTNGNAA